MEVLKEETKLSIGSDISSLSGTGEGRLRNQALGPVVAIEAELLKGARKYFHENGFTEVVVPHITKATGACENIATMFDLDYFGHKRYLVQTGQLYLEALIPKLGSTFCIGPSFRAEPDVDERHLTEFTLVEFEAPFGFDDLLPAIEGTVQSMISSVLENRIDDLDLLGIGTAHLERAMQPFSRITYTAAVQLLNSLGMDVKWGDDLKAAHEARVVAAMGNRPTFITHYPEEIKFFNMKRADNGVVNSADLILPFSGEAVGSAERENNADVLEEKLLNSAMLRMLEERGGSIEDFRWYLDLIRDSPIRHSGCGIGLNRVMQFVLKSGDIRTTTAYPMNRVSVI